MSMAGLVYLPVDSTNSHGQMNEPIAIYSTIASVGYSAMDASNGHVFNIKQSQIILTH
jgi:hypothetical protein